MRKFLFPRLAAQSMRNNRRFYLPYLLTVIGTVAAFYIMSALVFDPGGRSLRGYDYVQAMMSIGMVVAGLFSCLFLFYTNSFLMKRRKKELGLYNILGMGKRHIALILCWESLYIAVAGILCGLVAGVLLHKLVTLLLYKMLRYGVPFGFSISVRGLILTAVVFAFFLLLTLLTNLLRVRVSKPIELLHGGNVGEREPKTRWLLTLLGVVALGFGYWLALTVKNGVEAIGFYFVAVIAVIVGTYCLFTSVSIFVLKLLRRNKKFYYKTSHFIGVSGMLYRMKQNAVGLANICILSTMVMVMISGTLSMYLGTEDSIQAMSPADLTAMVRYDPAAEEPFRRDVMLTQIDAALAEQNVSVLRVDSLSYLPFTAGWTEDGQLTANRDDAFDMNAISVVALTAADYAALTDTAPVALAADEALIRPLRPLRDNELRLDFGDAAPSLTYRAVQVLEDFPSVGNLVSSSTGCCYLVVADEAALTRLYEAQLAIYGDNASSLHWEGRFDLDCTDEEALAFDVASMESGIDFTGTGSWDIFYFNLRAEAAAEAYSMTGGFLFLGIFLGFIFLLATVLIIYYKQISEGYEDKERFEIMQKVGLSPAEVRRSIRSQILMVFFLPILVAAIHIAFDFNMVIKLLSLFSLTNVTLTALCTAGTLLVFCAVYAIVYILTARTYYKIVS